MLRFRKIMSTSIAATMLITSMGFGAVAENPDEAVYTFINEYGNTEVITQAQLDAEHWNKNALGDVIPGIYETFPMKMTGFANDFGELSLELKYMKVLSDMDNVSFKITNLANDNVIYNETVTAPMFYSPALVIGGQYEVVLTEIVDGETTEYKRVVFAEKTTADMPEYVTNPTDDNEEIILIADVDRLRAGYTVDENGNTEVDASVATYDKVKACDFTAYCNTLDSNKIYRVFTNDEGKQYAGYISTDNESTEIYGLELKTYTWDDLYAVSPISLPSNVTTDDVVANSTLLNLRDASFRLRENSTSAKYEAFEVSIPNQYINGNSSETPQFNVTITGTSAITAKIWMDAGNGNLTFVRNLVSNNSENSATFEIDMLEYTATNYLSFYFMIYFPESIEGYGMINYEAVTGTGFTDDVTGSVYDAFNGLSNSSSTMSNTEYAINSAWDIDAFSFNYWGTRNVIFKIVVKNRSLADQALLESGTYAEGGGDKYITFWDVDETSDGFVRWTESSTYTIAPNTDFSVFNDALTTGDNVYTIYAPQTYGFESNDYYQLEMLKYLQTN